MRADRQRRGTVGRARVRPVADTRWSTARRIGASTEYENAFEDGVDLGETLTRDGTTIRPACKTDLTPLLSMQLYGQYQEDIFKSEPLRNATSRRVRDLSVRADAVVTGIVTAGYRDMELGGSAGRSRSGASSATAALTYPFLEVGRLQLRG